MAPYIENPGGQAWALCNQLCGWLHLFHNTLNRLVQTRMQGL